MGASAGGAKSVRAAARAGRLTVRDKATLQVGREALASGDWAGARDLLGEFVASDDSPSGEALFLLASAHKRCGAWDEAAVAMQRAYHAFVDEEDHASAARAAINMVSTSSASGDWSAAKGWENRGRRHVAAR